MMKFFLCLYCLLVASVAQGHLGETRNQVQKRLGKGLDADDQPVKGARTFNYTKLPYVVDVVFYKHLSQEERYISVKANLSHEEIETILRNNSGGKTWVKSHRLSDTTVPRLPETVPCWTCTVNGRRLSAIYQYDPYSLTYQLKVQTDEYKRAVDAAHDNKPTGI